MRNKFGWRGLVALLAVGAMLVLTPSPASSADPWHTGDLVLGHIVLDPGGQNEVLIDLSDPGLLSVCPSSGLKFEALFTALEPSLGLPGEWGHVEVMVSGDTHLVLGNQVFNFTFAGGTITELDLATYHEVSGQDHDYVILDLVVLLGFLFQELDELCDPIEGATCFGTLTLDLHDVRHLGDIPPSQGDKTLINGGTDVGHGDPIFIFPGDCVAFELVYHEKDVHFVGVLVEWQALP